MTDKTKNKTMWLSKYALTNGVVREIKVCDSYKSDDYIREAGDAYCFYRVGRECFQTREEAIADAERRRKAKIASLKKQTAKLEALTFGEEGA